MISDSQTGSGFTGAARYITGKAEGEEESWTEWAKRQAGVEEKVQAVQTRNILLDDNPQEAAEEMRVVANQNGRVEKPRYSVSLSYHPDDDPSDEQMMRDMDDFLERRGLAKHQAILAIHRDRDHDHIHGTINRVHPQTGELWRDSFDYFENMDVLRQIEQERGWTQPQRDEDRGRMADWKIQRFKRTGELPFSQEVLSAAGDDFAQAVSWEGLQKRLADKGLQVTEKGSGGVVTDGEEEAPLSELARKWSFTKLDDKYPDNFQTHGTQRSDRTGGKEAESPERRAEGDQKGGHQSQGGSQEHKERNGRDHRRDDRGGGSKGKDAGDQRGIRSDEGSPRRRGDDGKESGSDIRREGSRLEDDQQGIGRRKRSGDEDQEYGDSGSAEADSRESDHSNDADPSPLEWRSAEILGDHPDEIEEVERIDGEGIITIPEKLTGKGRTVWTEISEDNPLKAAREWTEMTKEDQKHDWKRLGKNDKVRLRKALKMLKDHRNQQDRDQNQSRSQSQSQDQSKDRNQGRDRGGGGRAR